MAEQPVAAPTEQSMAHVAPKTAARLGYDYVAMCQHCGRPVTLAGVPRPDGWMHRDTCLVPCRDHDLAQHAALAQTLARG